jgi:hypothetical protein
MGDPIQDAAADLIRRYREYVQCRENLRGLTPAAPSYPEAQAEYEQKRARLVQLVGEDVLEKMDQQIFR